MVRVETIVSFLFVGLLACAGLSPLSAAQDEGVVAVTKPSGDVTMSFSHPGRIAKLLVAEGNEVKAGQLLVQQDDSAEQVQLAQLKAQADDITRIKASEAEMMQKKVDLRRMEQLSGKGAASETELEHAKLDVLIGELSVQLAKFNNEQDRRKYEETRLQVERMKIISPIDATVVQTFMKAGESVDTPTKVIRVVQVNPLWVDVAVPKQANQKFLIGQKAEIVLPYGEGKMDGKVTFISEVEDAASQTVAVRVEVPNPARRRAGENVRVIFPSGNAQAGETPAPKASARTAATQPVAKPSGN